MLPKEDRGPGPVQRQLGGVERQGGGRRATKAAPVPVNQVAGVAHPGVQGRPHRTEGPVGRPPLGPFQVFVPSLWERKKG